MSSRSWVLGAKAQSLEDLRGHPSQRCVLSRAAWNQSHDHAEVRISGPHLTTTVTVPRTIGSPSVVMVRATPAHSSMSMPSGYGGHPGACSTTRTS
jgi:hypothetical protein